ncbi:zinc transporter ZIP9 isoform X2 [Hydra vulgaris]|uniref:Zinc transporter ZIP9 isoform X2 n=1 Tax=Hydra vulgaris TaxID=6087 RepID=A0ABM4CGR1_HYDVU
MDPSTRLLGLSFAMLVGCYVFGLVPLTVSLSEKNIRTMSITGAGLIVGAALSVIIPEGVHSLYEQQLSQAAHSHHVQSRSLNHAVENHKEVNYNGISSWASLQQRFVPEFELHAIIGISLTLGFVFMLLIDHLCGGSHSHASNENGRKKSVTATIGLLVHAAADGIALGAAASTTRADVEMIVFIAIMLHKGPAAFGLTSFLLHEGLERSRIRRHLLAFSLSAPISAVVTYYGLSQTNKETLSSINGTGLAMLFSAGTFLYVATVHILPELLSHAISKDGSLIQTEHNAVLSRKDLLFLVIGILSPLFLGMYHKH